jgi:hypothetical protein
MQITYTTYFKPLEAPPRTVSVKVGATLGDPYRGDDHLAIRRIGQHLSIALDLAKELVPLGQRLAHAIESRAAESAQAYGAAVGSRWEQFWSQMEDACRIAASRGRDVSAYDQARERARDLSPAAAYVEIEPWTDAGYNAKKRTVWFRMPAITAVPLALEALEAAVPEAEIESQPPAPDLRGRRLPWRWILLAIVIALGIAIGVYEWNLMHRPSMR